MILCILNSSIFLIQQAEIRYINFLWSLTHCKCVTLGKYGSVLNSIRRIWTSPLCVDRFSPFFVCFFVPPENCLLIWSVTFAGEGLQILTYARHSLPLSSEDFLVCDIYCDTGHPFIMIISNDQWHSHLLPSVCTSY